MSPPPAPPSPRSPPKNPARSRRHAEQKIVNPNTKARPESGAGPSAVPDTCSRRDVNILTERGAQQVLVCDTCRAELRDPNDQTVPHFDTIDAATDHALGLGWQFEPTDTPTATAASRSRPA
jgi:hypothetical protein